MQPAGGAAALLSDDARSRYGEIAYCAISDMQKMAYRRILERDEAWLKQHGATARSLLTLLRKVRPLYGNSTSHPAS
jgi:hypothetical protein